MNAPMNLNLSPEQKKEFHFEASLVSIINEGLQSGISITAIIGLLHVHYKVLECKVVSNMLNQTNEEIARMMDEASTAVKN